MSKTIRQFDYLITQTETPEDRPFSPYLHICLDNWSPSPGGVPRITPRLMSEGEIDSYVKALKEDLDNVARRSKAALKRAKEKTSK